MSGLCSGDLLIDVCRDLLVDDLLIDNLLIDNPLIDNPLIDNPMQTRPGRRGTTGTQEGPR